MSKKVLDINEMLLESHRKGLEIAKEASIRTGVPLVVGRDGKICYIKPEFKYILVPIDYPESKVK